MTKNEIIEIIKQFVEGKLPIKEFEQYAKHNSDFRSFVEFEKMVVNQKYKSILNLIDDKNWNNVNDQSEIFLEFECFLWNYDKTAVSTNYYVEQAQKFGNIYPDWLSDDAVLWVDENIVKNAPQDQSESQKKKWIKQKIKETFKYDKKPPKWAQSGKWPQDENGNFLIFVKQSQSGDLVTYTFRNDKTKEEVKVEEYY